MVFFIVFSRATVIVYEVRNCFTNLESFPLCSWYKWCFGEGTGRTTAIKERTGQEAVVLGLFPNFFQEKSHLECWMDIWSTLVSSVMLFWRKCELFLDLFPGMGPRSTLATQSWSKNNQILTLVFFSHLGHIVDVSVEECGKIFSRIHHAFMILPYLAYCVGTSGMCSWYCSNSGDILCRRICSYMWFTIGLLFLGFMAVRSW